MKTSNRDYFGVPYRNQSGVAAVKETIYRNSTEPAAWIASSGIRKKEAV
jgi:hypothetical protein